MGVFGLNMRFSPLFSCDLPITRPGELITRSIGPLFLRCSKNNKMRSLVQGVNIDTHCIPEGNHSTFGIFAIYLHFIRCLKNSTPEDCQQYINFGRFFGKNISIWIGY